VNFNEKGAVSPRKWSASPDEMANNTFSQEKVLQDTA